VTEVITTDEFRDWYFGLSVTATEAVERVVSLLEERGTLLGFPFSSAIAGSKYPLRELRVQAQGHPLRVFYIFDEERQAVILLGGDKQGDDRFYAREVPRAERIWEQFRKEQGK
jgi:hypothetical protein